MRLRRQRWQRYEWFVIERWRQRWLRIRKRICRKCVSRSRFVDPCILHCLARLLLVRHCAPLECLHTVATFKSHSTERDMTNASIPWLQFKLLPVVCTFSMYVAAWFAQTNSRRTSMKYPVCGHGKIERAEITPTRFVTCREMKESAVARRR